MKPLLKKELRELVRTKRVIFLPLLFIVLGISGPALIRLLPLLLESSGEELGIELPEMGPADGMLQYLELARQFGLLAVILVYMGIVAGERRDGLLVTVLVKPVSRLGYLASRWLVNGGYVAASFVLGTAVALLYTYLLLGRPDIAAVGAAGGLYLTYVLLAFSWTTAFSSLTRSAGVAAGLSLIPLFALPLVGYLWAPLGEYGPYGAVAAGTAALGGADSVAQAVPWSALMSSALNLAGSLALLGAAYLAIRDAEL